MKKIKKWWVIVLVIPWSVFGLAIVSWYSAHSSTLVVSGGEQSAGKQSERPAAMANSNDFANKKPSTADAAASKPITLLFGGDLMFDRYIRQAADKRGNDFVFAPALREQMRAADTVIANLEGPMTSQPSKSVGSAIGSRENYIFSFDPSWAKTLRDNNISTVNIGNNHILNFGEEGLTETEHSLTEAGVQFFGAPGVQQSADGPGDPNNTQRRTAVLTIKGVKIGLVNENQFVADGETKALDDARQLRPQVDVLVAYTHWGKEYLPATDDERRRAHALIEAGVDAVIGSHPHVVQEQEVYQGKTIYYSLGNFVFDQYEQPETMRGLLVLMTIDPATKAVNFREMPLALEKNGQTRLVE